ncbi:hypothetical protein PENSPDRAFT_254677 [Peniophora sp. CONT]|nr:hypothetical protein PENSPDRAFT_254677 [Peniophora sp. CONT]
MVCNVHSLCCAAGTGAETSRGRYIRTTYTCCALTALLHTHIMRYIATYLLLQLGGITTPSASDIQRVLDAVGIQRDNRRLDQFLVAIKGKDVAQLIREGSAQLVVQYTSLGSTCRPDVQESSGPLHIVHVPGKDDASQTLYESGSDSMHADRGTLLFD